MEDDPVSESHASESVTSSALESILSVNRLADISTVTDISDTDVEETVEELLVQDKQVPTNVGENCTSYFFDTPERESGEITQREVLISGLGREQKYSLTQTLLKSTTANPVKSCQEILGNGNIKDVVKEHIKENSKRPLTYITRKKSPRTYNTHDILTTASGREESKVVPHTSKSQITSSKSDEYVDSATQRGDSLATLEMVKNTLQANAQMVNDRVLLDDLLNSIGRKSPNNEVSAKASTISCHSAEAKKDRLNSMDEGRDICASGKSIENITKPLNGEQHEQSEPVKLSREKRMTIQDVSVIGHSQDILRSLEKLQWRLGGVEEMAPIIPEGSMGPLVQKVVQQLHEEKLRSKYLSEQLEQSESLLKKCREELHILSGTEARREASMKEATSQLSTLHQEWATIQNRFCVDKKEMKTQIQSLLQDVTLWKSELKAREEELMKLKTRTVEMEGIEVALEEARSQLKEKTAHLEELLKQNAELIKENQSISDIKNHLECERIPELQKELEACVEQSRHTSLQLNEQDILVTKLKRNLVLLQAQNESLVERLVEEEEKKEAVMKEKMGIEEKVQTLSDQILCIKESLHQHYQAQMEKLIQEKTQHLQQQLNQLEDSLSEKMRSQMKILMEQHAEEKASIQSMYQDRIRKLSEEFGHEIQVLQQRLEALMEENRVLRSQRSDVVSAITSIFTSGNKAKVTSYIPENPSARRPVASGATHRSNQRNNNHIQQKNVFENVSEKGHTYDRGSDTEILRCSMGENYHLKQTEPSSVADEFTCRNVCISSISAQNEDKSQNSMIRNRLCEDLVPSLEVKVHSSSSSSSSSKEVMQTVREREKDNMQVDGQVPFQQSSQYGKSFPVSDGNQQNIGNCENKTFKSSPNEQQNLHLTAKEVELQRTKDQQKLSELESIDLEMYNLVKELKMMTEKSDRYSQVSEAPTHDTSFDPDPAVVTLKKLSQVSTVLSHYVDAADSS